jgi:hypothetical protein
VFVLVAVDTSRLAGSVDLARVAANTFRLGSEICVKSQQRKAGVVVVVKGFGPLASLHVTSLTGLVRKLPLVGAAVLMATRAGTRAVVEAGPLPMTRSAF